MLWDPPEKIFLGAKTISEYVEWQFFDPAHKNAIMFFHYGLGFDGLFILKELTNQGHAPKVICRGRKFILFEARFDVKVYLQANTSRKNGQKNQSLKEEQTSTPRFPPFKSDFYDHFLFHFP